jgi:hypothetical protein
MFKQYQWNKEIKKVATAPVVIGKNGKIVPTAKAQAQVKAKAPKKAKVDPYKNDTMTRDDFMGYDEMEGEEMEGVLDFFSDINDKYLKAPIQKAIDTNKAKIIEKATSAGINTLGKALDKVGATDPKKLASVQALTASLTAGAVEGAQASLMEKVKPYIPYAIGGAVLIGALYVMKKSKKSQPAFA